jgi:hypothetical protein
MIGLSIGLGMARAASGEAAPSGPEITDTGTITATYLGYPGAAHSCSVAVSAEADTLAYQWQDDGVDIAGATSQNITSAQTTGRSGALRRKVTASNEDGDTVAYTDAITLTTRSLPTVVGSGGTTSGTGTIQPALHASTTTGDLISCHAETANQALTMSTYTSIADAEDGSGTGGDVAATMAACLWKIAGAAEAPGTTNDPGDHVMSKTLSFRGAVSMIRLDGEAGAVAASPITWPTIVTPVDNCIVVVVATYAQDANTPVWGTPTFASLANVANHLNGGQLQGNGGGLAISTGEKAVAGDLGAFSATTSRAPDTFARVAYAVIPI